MKALLLIAILAASSAFAQQPPQPPAAVPAPQPPGAFAVPRRPVRTLPTNASPNQNAAAALTENLQVLLTLSDRDTPPLEISLLTAGANFLTQIADLGLNFTGTIAADEAGVFAISYALNWEPGLMQIAGGTPQTKQTATNGNILLKIGEEVQIFRAGNRIARLALKKAESVPVK